MQAGGSPHSVAGWRFPGKPGQPTPLPPTPPTPTHNTHTLVYRRALRVGRKKPFSMCSASSAPCFSAAKPEGVR